MLCYNIILKIKNQKKTLREQKFVVYGRIFCKNILKKYKEERRINVGG